MEVSNKGVVLTSTPHGAESNGQEAIILHGNSAYHKGLL